MSTHEHTVVVERPIRVVYDQWTQFETYPEFMDDVEDVRQLTETVTHWKVKVAGFRREYDAAITDQLPDELIAWHTVDGPEQGGAVRFAPVDPERTRVTLRLDFDPSGLAENIGDAAGVVSSSVEHSLERFKDFIEGRGSQTGSWRGTIAGGGPAGGAGDTVPGDALSHGPDTGDWLAGRVVERPEE